MLGVLEYAEVGCFDTVRNILDTDPFSIDDRDYVGCSALHKAAYNGFPRIVDLLLDYGAPVDSRDMDMFTPLHLACMSGSLASGEIIHILADRGADLSAQDKNGDTALHKACEIGNIEVVRILLSLQVDSSIRNYEEKTALDVSCMEIIDDIINHDDSLQCTPMLK